MLTQDTINRVNQIVEDAKAAVSGACVVPLNVVNACWNNISNHIWGQIQNILASGAQLNPLELRNTVENGLVTQIKMLQQQQQYQQPYGVMGPQFSGYMPSNLGSLNSVAMPVIQSGVPNNLYGNAASGSTSMSQQVLQQASGIQPSPNYLSLKSAIEQRKVEQKQPVITQIEVETEPVIDTEPVISKETEEVYMLNVKDCKILPVLNLANGDTCSEFKFELDGLCAARLFSCDIVSRGFLNEHSATAYAMDNLMDAEIGRVFASIAYTKLIGLPINNNTGAGVFKSLKAVVGSDDLSAKSQLLKIKDILDATSRIAGNIVDELITSMINSVTTKDVLQVPDTERVKFDDIDDIIMAMTSVKKSKYPALTSNQESVELLNAVVLKVIKTIGNATVYNFETVADVPYVMDCIGSKRVNDVTLRSMEPDLLATKSKSTKTTVSVKDHPLYPEIKKYTVIGIPSTVIYTNCEVMIDSCDEDECFSISDIMYDDSQPTTYIEFFIKNYRTTEHLYADLIVSQNANLQFKYKCMKVGDYIGLCVE